MDEIKNCLITNSDARVYKLWYGDISKSGPYHTGVDIEAINVYSISTGVVLEVGKYSGHICTTIQFDNMICVRYMNLTTVDVRPGQLILLNDFLGRADSHVHIEKLTPDRSPWPVRIGPFTFYKHDPWDIVSGEFVFISKDLSPEVQPSPATGVGGVRYE